MAMSSRYWLVVASFDHVALGADGCFIQVAHGREAPLRRIQAGDGIVYYSAKYRYGEPSTGGNRCRQFTALAQCSDDRIRRVELEGGFTPWRRDARYFPVSPTPIEPLLPALSFTRGRTNWGSSLRFGFIEIQAADFAAIASALCDPQTQALVERTFPFDA